MRQRGRWAAVDCSGLLLLGGVLVGLGGALGVAHTYDASPLGVASGAVWVVLLPALLALALGARKPGMGLAVAAGAGVVGLARLVSDLSLLTGPNTAIRPELFYEVSSGAQPFRTAGGAYLVVLGDLVMVVAGVLAARRLSGELSFPAEPIFDTRPSTPQAAGLGPELLAAALESADLTQAASRQAEEAQDHPERNNWLIFVGFVGVLGLLTASLALPYTGGYLTARYLPPGLDLWGVAAALAVAVVATTAVLAAAVVARPIAFALLGGVAIGAAVPFLTAVVVLITAAPVRLNPSVGLGLAGALVLAAAGLLSRGSWVTDEVIEPSRHAVRTLNLIGAVLSLLVALAAAAAWKLPQLRYNGGADPVLANGFAISAPLAAPFLLAVIAPAVGGLLWLLPQSARAGRAVSSVGWIALVFAVAQSLYLLGEVVTSASVPNGAFAPPTWSAGAGLWCGIVGIALGPAVLTVSVTASRRATDASSLLPEDDSLTRARAVGTWVAGGLTVITVVGLVMPVYRTTTGSSGTLLLGFALDSWGVLALALGSIAAAWAAARAQWMSQAVAYALAGAATLAVRLVIPAAVRAQDGYQNGPGLYGGYVAVVAFIAAAAVLGLSARRIRMGEPAVRIRPRPAGKR